MDKKFLFLASLLLIISSCTSGNGDGELSIPGEIRQWAISAEASSSYGGIGMNRDDQSAFSATGEPDAELCDDSLRAWVIEQEDDGLQWLELTYYDKVYVSGVRVLESFGPGAVVKIELKNDSNYFTLWEGSYSTRACSFVLEKSYKETQGNITIDMTPFSTDTVRITLDTDVPGWNEIDAVELIGYEQRWYMFNDSIITE